MQQIIYTTDAADQFCWVELDDLTAIFHRPSGETHVVADPVPQILDCLAGDALSVDALLTRLAAEHDLPLEAETRAALLSRLEELEQAGLVFRA